MHKPNENILGNISHNFRIISFLIILLCDWLWSVNGEKKSGEFMSQWQAICHSVAYKIVVVNFVKNILILETILKINRLGPSIHKKKKKDKKERRRRRRRRRRKNREIIRST